MQGILFTETMFRAVIRGYKTQTRRLIKIHKDGIHEDGITDWYNKIPHLNWQPEEHGFYYDTNEGESIKAIPRYQPREIVYLKEPYRIPENIIKVKGGLIDYKYDWKKGEPCRDLKFKNKLFMPAKYARYFIRIKDVRVENVGDISNDDAICEGFNSKENFINTFTKINKLKIWDRPWVFVYSFELTEKPETLNL